VDAVNIQEITNNSKTTPRMCSQSVTELESVMDGCHGTPWQDGDVAHGISSILGCHYS
jgi:hypothetical protein